MTFDGELVVIDTNVIGKLKDRGFREKVLASARTAGMRIAPSAMNSMEIGMHRNAAVAKELHVVIAELSRSFGVLEPPLDIFERLGEAKSGGAKAVSLNFYGYNPAAAPPAELTEKVRGYLASEARAWETDFAQARRKVQADLKRGKLDEQWQTVEVFLERRWPQTDMMGALIRHLWVGLELPSSFDSYRMRHEEPWRLYAEGVGVNFYRQCFDHEQGKRVDPPDILQLMYLGLSKRRAFVTGDGPLGDLARTVLVGRYANARVFTPEEFFAHLQV